MSDANALAVFFVGSRCLQHSNRHIRPGYRFVNSRRDCLCHRLHLAEMAAVFVTHLAPIPLITATKGHATMRKALLVMALSSLALPAMADTDNSVTLLIENHAGILTEVRDMTQRECDAARSLLSARPVSSSPFTISSSTLSLYGSNAASAPDPTVRSAKCVRPTDKK